MTLLIILILTNEPRWKPFPFTTQPSQSYTLQSVSTPIRASPRDLSVQSMLRLFCEGNWWVGCCRGCDSGTRLGAWEGLDFPLKVFQKRILNKELIEMYRDEG
jgi:hypothetical protein